MKIKEISQNDFEVQSGLHEEYTIVRKYVWRGMYWYKQVEIYLKDKSIFSAIDNTDEISNKAILQIIERHKKRPKAKYYKVESEDNKIKLHEHRRKPDVNHVYNKVCETDEGELYISNGRWITLVNYCPICGYKAKKQIEVDE